MLDVVVATLQGDAALGALLTGGIYAQQVVNEISRQGTPAAYDAFAELKPCALVAPESVTPWGPLRDSGRYYFTIWFYQQHGAASIEQARTRVYTLLHRQQLSATAGIYDVRHANDVMGIEAQALSALGIMSRYVATVQRA